MQLFIEELEHYFEGRRALQMNQLEFAKGRFYGIIGPNGSGKTTLLKLISQLIKTQKGKIKLMGEDIARYKEKERAKLIALVPQIFNMEYSFSVLEIVSMGRYPYLQTLGELQEVDHQKVQEALEKTDLLGYTQRAANTLSGGELQRVILARALAQETDILLLDEPLSHLDIHHQLDILTLIKKLCQEAGMTAICVMHDLNLTMKFCDQVVMIKEGSLFAKGLTNDVITKENISKVYNIDAEIVDIHGQKRIIY
ncbi:MAG: ABC transporter ATP-binding protein [Vallitaleaceae bacterium]|nr:ABC transporter ATP-binding protein [Vallitaleaceae bacterium]